MNSDYNNFVARMGSFEDTLDFDDNDELKHYGILGMKWGKRKAQTEEVKPDKTKMSDAELNERLKRLRMESEFDRLSGNIPPAKTSALLEASKTITAAATLTTSALAIYNNLDKMSQIAINASKSKYATKAVDLVKKAAKRG